MTSTGSHRKFDCQSMAKHFKLAIQPENGDVDILAYCDAYEDICRLLAMLGTLFTFVEHDVAAKIKNIRELISKSDSPSGTTSSSLSERKGVAAGGVAKPTIALCSAIVKREIDQESSDSNLKKKVILAKYPLSVDIVRLHRALDFVNKLIRGLVEMDNSDWTSAVCKKAYADSLAPMHPFVVRNAVKLASYTLPAKTKLFSILFGDISIEKGEQLIRESLEYSVEAYRRMVIILDNPKLPHIPQS